MGKIEQPTKVKGKKWGYIRFRGSLFLMGVKSFFKFIRRIPGYYWLNQFWDCEPQFFTWVMKQYEEVMYDITGGKLSKPSHSAGTVLQFAWDYIDEIFREREEENKEADKPESST